MEGKHFCIKVVLLISVLASLVSCNKEENSLVYNKTKLAGVSNLRAFSVGANSVGLIWLASPDANKSEYVNTKITAKVGATEWSSRTVPKTLTDSVIVVENLNEGTVYSFELVCKAASSSQNYTDSDPVTIQWAPARRLNGDVPIKVYEVASTKDSSGLQFFDGIGSSVLSARSPSYQPILDVVIDSTASGGVIMKSGHLNRFGGGTRRTRFSSFDTLASTLNFARATAPNPSTYTRDSIFIGPENLTSGKVFYAVTDDTNYVRILFEKNSPAPSDPGSLLFGSPPNRYLSIKLSFQTIKGIIYSKPKTGDLDYQRLERDQQIHR